MSHHHFSLIERGKIEELNKLGYSSRAIGERIGRHHSSVARELQRLPTHYTAQAASEDYLEEKSKKQAYRKMEQRTGNPDCRQAGMHVVT